MDRIELVWQQVRSTVAATRMPSFEALEAWLEQQAHQGQPHALQLRGQQSKAPADDTSAQALAEAVLAHCLQERRTASTHVHPYSHAYAQAQQWLLWIHQLRVTLERQGPAGLHATRIAPTPLLLPARAHPSPYAPERDALARRAQRWRAALLDALGQGLERLNADQWQAALVLSALLCGALLDPDKVRQWLALACGGTLERTAAGDPWVLFRHTWHNAGLVQHQRWLLDPVSRLLWLQRPSGALVPRKMPALLRVAARWLRTNDLPPRLGEVVDACRAWWHRHASALALGLISRELDNHDLQSAAWASLMGVGAPHAAAPGHAEMRNGTHNETREDPSRSMEDGLGERLADRLADLHPWYAHLRRALLSEADVTMRDAALQSAQQLCTPHERIYVDWAHSCLHPRGRSAALPPSAACAMIAELVVRLEQTEPAKLSADTLALVLLAIVREANDRRSSAALARAAHAFLRYLDKVSAPSPSSRRAAQVAVFEEGGLQVVDAAPIEPRIYRAALDRLQRPRLAAQPEPVLHIARLVLMLAYRSGMRRREILGLRLCDVAGEAPLVLLVRPHEGRRLKTAAATRVIPAFILLEASEQDALREWIALRRAKGARATDLLFDANLGSQPMSEERLAERIIEALSKASGKAAKLHQLRHAFATWMYLGLYASEYPQLLGFFDHEPSVQQELRRIAGMRSALLGHTAVTNRALGHVMARLLGHISPTVSLAHYIHAQVFVHGAITLRMAQTLPPKLLYTMAGLSTSWGHRLREQGVLSFVRHVEGQRASVASVSRRGRPRTHTAPVQPGPDLDVVRDVLAGRADAPNTQESAVPAAVRTAIEQAAQTWASASVRRALGMDVQARPLHLPLPQRNGEVAWAQELQQRLARAFALDFEATLEGIRVHFEHYNGGKRDVVFHGPEHRAAWRSYVRWIELLQLPPSRLCIVLRGKGIAAPTWTGRKPAWMRGVCVKHIAPNVASSPAYRSWIGLAIVADNGRILGQVTLVTLFLAVLGAIAQRGGTGQLPTQPQ